MIKNLFKKRVKKGYQDGYEQGVQDCMVVMSKLATNSSGQGMNIYNLKFTDVQNLQKIIYSLEERIRMKMIRILEKGTQ